MTKLVVIGGDAAGMSGASQLRRLRPEFDITVFERGGHTSYSACGIPYYVAGLVDNPQRLVSRTPQVFREKQNMDVRILHEVTSINPSSKRVTVHNLADGAIFDEPYDELLIATGALPIRPPVPGIDALGVFGVSTLDSGIELRKFVDERKPQHVVVVGGGYIGLEMAEAFNCERGLKVSLVERADTVMGTMDSDMGAMVGDALREVGIELFTGETLTSIEKAPDGRACAVHTDKRSIAADLVILGLGVRPNSELASRCGIRTGVKGAIEVDDTMRTSVPHIWAAGDCVQSVNMATGKPFHVALGTVANKQGRVVGINISGGNARYLGSLGTAVCKICKYEVARTGIMERELAELGITPLVAKIEEYTRAGYYPGVGDMTVKLMCDRASGRVLGGQIVGIEGAAKRIDVIATAIQARLTVQDMVDLDLSYAPPFSPVWDPVQVAARKALSMLNS